MSVSLTNEAKTKVSLTAEGKNADMTWDSSDPQTWDDMDSSWDAPKISVQNEVKSKVSLNNEAK